MIKLVSFAYFVFIKFVFSIKIYSFKLRKIYEKNPFV